MKYVLIITFVSALFGKISYGQDDQAISINCSKGIEFTLNKPEDKKQFVSTQNLKITIRTEDLQKLESVLFLDASGTPKITLAQKDFADFKVAENKNRIEININNSQKIINSSNVQNIPFPFIIKVKYENTESQTEIIGTEAKSNQASSFVPNPNTQSRQFTGIAYYDALTIRALIKDQKYLDLITFMRPYFDNLPPKAGIQDLKAAAKNNKFLKEVFDLIPEGKGETVGVSGFSSLSPTSIGNLDITNLADGFAKFLVKRTKQELSIAFFDRFNKFISNNKYKDARILFPKTYLTLQAIGNEIYNYQAYINALRESFEQDLNGLLPHLEDVVKTGKFSSNITKENKAICLSVLDIAQQLLNKKNAGNILADFNLSNLDGFANEKGNNIKAAAQTLILFSQALRFSGTEHYWITNDMLQTLINDPDAAKIFLGLVSEKASAITFCINGTSKTLKDIFNEQSDKTDKYYSYIQTFLKKTSIVSESVANISGKQVDKLTFTDYYNLYNSSIDLIGYVANTKQLPGLGSLLSDDDKVNDYINIAKTASSIALDINRKNFSSAIINSLQIYNTATTGIGEANEFAQELLKFGSFMAAVVLAKNSDDVEAAIEAIALPSGSARIKRESPFNVSLNAYAGLYAGYERIKEVDAKYSFMKFNSYGVTAPVGISISLGQQHLFKPFCGLGHTSFSLFLSLIDIGAITAFRFNSDSIKLSDTTKASTTQIPSVKLKDIISPGLFLSIGIPKSPLSINIGAQMGPNLRQVNVASSTNNIPRNDYSNNTYWRYSISFCVDIPIINMYTKSK